MTELQVPSSIVFGDVLVVLWFICLWTMDKCQVLYSLGLAFFKDVVPQRYDFIIFVPLFGHMDD